MIRPTREPDEPFAHFKGRPARIVIELEMRKSTLRVPIGDLAQWDLDKYSSFGTVTLLVGSPLVERLYDVERNAMLSYGDV